MKKRKHIFSVESIRFGPLFKIGSYFALSAKYNIRKI